MFFASPSHVTYKNVMRLMRDIHLLVLLDDTGPENQVTGRGLICLLVLCL